MQQAHAPNALVCQGQSIVSTVYVMLTWTTVSKLRKQPISLELLTQILSILETPYPIEQVRKKPNFYL